jgi:hypothetical protein
MSVTPPSTSPARGGFPPILESWLPKEHSLYRPRHSKRQRTALTCALVFFLTPALLLTLGVRPDNFENRALKDFPSPGDGWGFFTGLSGWASDHLPLRKLGVETSDAISTGVFGDPAGAALGSRQGTLGIPAGGGAKTPVVYPNVFTGKDGWLYYGEDVHARCEPVTNVDQVTDGLNRLRRSVESSGRKFVLTFAPDKRTMEPTHLPDSYVGKDCANSREADFWNKVPGGTGAIDLRPPLVAAAKQLGKPVYDPYDTHWTYAGGLVMTYAIAQAIKPDITRTWKVEPNGIRPWTGDLELLVGKTVDRKLTAFSLSPDGKTGDRTRYLASDFKVPLRLAQTDPQPPAGTVLPKLAIIADSYTQFATPFVTAAFRDVIIVHTDTVAALSAEQVAELFGDRDVIAFEFVERNVVGGGSTMLRDQAADRFTRGLAQRPKK